MNFGEHGVNVKISSCFEGPAGAVGIFPSKIVTSPNCLKFHMHVSGGDSNNFSKFYEFWRTF